MDYAAARAAFFAPNPPGTPVPDVVESGGPARRLRDAAEPIAMHSVWSPLTNERHAALGLNFLTGYIWGRAAALGNASPAVVASAFAWFETGLMTEMVEQGRAHASLEQMIATRDAATEASLGEVLAGEDIAPVADRMAAAVVLGEPMGRPLFAGLLSRPWPGTPAGRLWRACELLREHRGDSHTVAVAAAGLGPVEANILTELSVGYPLGAYTASRGWAPEQVAAGVERLEARGWLADAELTLSGRQARAAIEAVTDAQEQPLVEALGSHLEGIVSRLDAWSARCIDAGAFPPDLAKRAAG
ncbi:MAG: hypothetical protein M3Z02_07675 [Actinomycetota bacterium]|nr:hypothetical protein [Actinomycetota bacterium]